jgi:2-C-methyl-D-erythritol 4-phosphate cytidylyltransferase
VVVAGSSQALTPVGATPMVLCAVRALLGTGFVDRVTVLADPALRPQVESACSTEPVRVCGALRHGLRGVGTHALQRADGTGSDAALTAGGDEIVVLHDALRPLAPVALARTVVSAVRDGHDMAVPVLALPDTVKQVDGHGVVTATPDRSLLRVLQTPLAIRSALLPADVGADPLEVVRRRTADGATAHTVPGHPAAFAVHSAWDLELAGLVAEGTITL